MKRTLSFQTPHGTLYGQLDCPDAALGLVLIARAQHATLDTPAATGLAARGYAIFAVELLSDQEAQFADASQNVPRLAQRLIDVLDLIRLDGDMQDLPLAILAAGDISPAAIRAAAQRDTQVKVLACHGGIIDRAGLQALKLLVAPLLMLFDADDPVAPPAFRRAAAYLGNVHEMHVLEAGEDPVTRVAAWLGRHLRG